MSYLTAQQLTAALAAAAIPNVSTPTAPQLASAINIADSRVNTSVRAGSFTVPVANPSNDLVTAATSLALYALLMDLRRFPQSIPAIVAGSNAALRYLNGVSRGTTNPSAA